MNSRNTALGAAVLLAAAISPSAMAEPAPEIPPSLAVSYSDLNVASPAGVARLYRRIQKAAEQVCDYPLDLDRVREVMMRKGCKARATERAVMQVDISALNALHLASKKHEPQPAQLATNE